MRFRFYNSVRKSLVAITTIFRGPSSKSQGLELSDKCQGLLAARCRAAAEPIAPKPAAAPAPPAAAPAEVPDAEVAIGVAIDGSPEEDRLLFPVLRNEMGVLQVEVQQIGVIDRHALELLTKFGALDPLAILLTFVQVKIDPSRIKLELATFHVRFHLPTIRNVGIDIEVNVVVRDDDLDFELPFDCSLKKFIELLRIKRITLRLSHLTLDLSQFPIQFHILIATEYFAHDNLLPYLPAVLTG